MLSNEVKYNISPSSSKIFVDVIFHMLSMGCAKHIQIYILLNFTTGAGMA
jgi:hypothetical protein